MRTYDRHLAREGGLRSCFYTLWACFRLSRSADMDGARPDIPERHVGQFRDAIGGLIEQKRLVICKCKRSVSLMQPGSQVECNITLGHFLLQGPSAP